MKRLILVLCMVQIPCNSVGAAECTAEEGSLVTMNCIVSYRKAARSFGWNMVYGNNANARATCFFEQMKCHLSGSINQANITKIDAFNATSFFIIPSVKMTDQGLWICYSGSETVPVCDLRVLGTTKSFSSSVVRSQASNEGTQFSIISMTSLSTIQKTIFSATEETTKTVLVGRHISTVDPGKIKSENLSDEIAREDEHASLKIIIASVITATAVFILVIMLLWKFKGCRKERGTVFDRLGVTMALTAPSSRQPTESLPYYSQCV